MKHYREVKATDRLPDQEKDQNGELLRFTIPYHLLTESHVRTVGYYDFELKQWFAEDYPESTIQYWLEPFDPEEEAQKRYELACVALRDSRMGIMITIEEEKALQIASGLTPKK